MRIRALILAVAVIVGGGMQMRAQMSGPPAVAAGGYKRRPRERGGRFALHDGVSGSGRGEGYAS